MCQVITATFDFEAQRIKNYLRREGLATNILTCEPPYFDGRGYLVGLDSFVPPEVCFYDEPAARLLCSSKTKKWSFQISQFTMGWSTFSEHESIDGALQELRKFFEILKAFDQTLK